MAWAPADIAYTLNAWDFSARALDDGHGQPGRAATSTAAAPRRARLIAGVRLPAGGEHHRPGGRGVRHRRRRASPRHLYRVPRPRRARARSSPPSTPPARRAAGTSAWPLTGVAQRGQPREQLPGARRAGRQPEPARRARLLSQAGEPRPRHRDLQPTSPSAIRASGSSRRWRGRRHRRMRGRHLLSGRRRSPAARWRCS